jgi:hypothetical protein
VFWELGRKNDREIGNPLVNLDASLALEVECEKAARRVLAKLFVYRRISKEVRVSQIGEASRDDGDADEQRFICIGHGAIAKDVYDGGASGHGV